MRKSPLRASAWRYGQFVFVLLLWASGASAKVIIVSWADMVHLADRHPRLAAQRLQINAAAGAVSAAGAVPNPSLDATVGRGDARGGDASRAEWNLTLTLPLGWIAQRRSRIEAAVAEAAVTVAESEALRRAETGGGRKPGTRCDGH